MPTDASRYQRMTSRSAAATAAVGRVARLSRHIVISQVPVDSSSSADGEGRLLAGIRVLELATVVAAPSACAILADLGANVLKVENPREPDYVRAWRFRDDPHKTADPGRCNDEDQVGTGFTQMNRGKRAIAIDFQKREGLHILKQLIANTDVLVTNVRSKGLRKMGLDYESLALEHPRLIYAHLTAWGRQGPREHDPGYDVGAFYAYTGLMDLCRSSNDASLPRYPAGFGDLLTGTNLVAGVALALLHRHSTGKGQLVDTSLLRSGIWSMSHPLTANAAGNSFASGPQSVIRGTTEIGERRTTITDAPYRCKDGRWVYLLGLESRRHWEKTIKALGLENSFNVDWGQVPREMDWRAATSLVDKVMAEKTYEEWHEIFRKADIWHTPVNRYEDVMTDLHANQSGAFTEVEGISHKLVKSPISLSSQVGKDGPCGRAPGFGEHTEAVLESLGYSSEEIRRLYSEGTIK